MDPSLAIGIAVFAGFMFSIIVHECAHVLVASWLGDDTARLQGRFTLNPIPHIDPFMSVLLPGVLLLSGSPVLFGGAKPVPVDMNNLRGNRLTAMMWVALAGPVSNVLLAFVFALVLNAIPPIHNWNPEFAQNFWRILVRLVITNMGLALFNLIPIPPLDGSRILAACLPRELAWKVYEFGHYGMILVMILAFSGATGILISGPMIRLTHLIIQGATFGTMGVPGRL